jgi:hypothetical protein
MSEAQTKVTIISPRHVTEEKLLTAYRQRTRREPTTEEIKELRGEMAKPQPSTTPA